MLRDYIVEMCVGLEVKLHSFLILAKTAPGADWLRGQFHRTSDLKAVTKQTIPVFTGARTAVFQLLSLYWSCCLLFVVTYNFERIIPKHNKRCIKSSSPSIVTNLIMKQVKSSWLTWVAIIMRQTSTVRKERVLYMHCYWIWIWIAIIKSLQGLVLVVNINTR
jgi:hypothetical protein